jgi:alkanesulfonate monooxygenase SsuD/methylene tetrahydromethanopterin reductase-like flavin-dependent oxidoreductase (luciferase family)
MEFGVFDHLDRGSESLQDLYEYRLRMCEAYDAAGFYAFHLAEHHSTPLGSAPSPSVFLAAAAQRTKRLRLGSMVYTLPLYHPLRVIEEACMLDQISGGRLLLGVGRGISPIEARYYGNDPAHAQAMFLEALDIVLAGLTGTSVAIAGEYFRFDDVPMTLEPLQKPHPPIWLGISSLASAQNAARRGFNINTISDVPETRDLVEAYRAAWDDLGNDAAAIPKIGLTRFIVVAETDAEAERIATRAYDRWHASFNHLYKLHGREPVLGLRPATYAASNAVGRAIAGKPATVAEFLQVQVDATNVNYVVGQFMFGDMTIDEGLHSVKLFERDVMPVVGAHSPGKRKLAI